MQYYSLNIIIIIYFLVMTSRDSDSGENVFFIPFLALKIFIFYTFIMSGSRRSRGRRVNS